ncbi:MAG: ATP-binding protein [Nitrospiraceae bacterium]|nr:ATP-binding protein [Nitrospiraceae bacterium]
MKKRILVSFALLLSLFLAGSIVAWTYISKTTSRMDTLIMLHQVEILREDLIIHIQQVQSQISHSRFRSGGDVDVLITNVQEMDRIMESCVGCHHAPELAQGLTGMRDLANDYKSAISRLVTATTNPQHIAQLEQRAQSLGQELIAVTQGMAFTANVRLQQRTQDTMATIREVRSILILTLALGCVLAVIIVVLLLRGLDARLKTLVDATRRISEGDLQHRVEAQELAQDEFSELAVSFNAMTQQLHRSQRQLLQSAKLAAIGELSTNIAYEVNNPLTGVLGYTGLLLKAEDVPADKKEHLRTIERETLRAREILKNLLDFARRKPPALVRTDISSIVEDTLAVVKGQARITDVDLRMECSAGLPRVAVDADDMRQVFVNLINNALHAMPKGGALTIRCGHESHGAGRDSVVITVSDTGHGIPDDHLDKIFDPFFTTRTDGEGAGLGLSMSYLIVQNHGGRIEVESSLGTGTTFRVVLPVQAESAMQAVV